MTRYQVDSDAVITATGAVRSSIDRTQAEVTGLHHHLQALQDSWTGPAAAAFQGVVADWHRTEQQMSEALGTMSRALGAAGQTYADTEQGVARMFAH